MIIFILRRLVLLVVTLLFLSTVSFSVSYFPLRAPLSGAAMIDAYRFYLSALLHGELGVSSINGQLIINQIKTVFPATIELCVLTFFMALVIGVPLGLIAGATRGRWPDRVISTFAMIGFSIPVYFMALLMMLFFSLHLEWLPISGRVDLLYKLDHVTGFALIDAWLSTRPYRHALIASVIDHLILIVTVLAVAPTTEVIRLMRASTADIFNSNYVKAAATRGLSRLTIIRRHVLHNALPPIIPTLGLQFSPMLTLIMIAEVVFSWPGMGQWLVSAIRQQDYAAISAGIMVIGTLVLLVNVLADIIGAATNPLKHKEWYALR